MSSGLIIGGLIIAVISLMIGWIVGSVVGYIAGFSLCFSIVVRDAAEQGFFVYRNAIHKVIIIPLPDTRSDEGELDY